MRVVECYESTALELFLKYTPNVNEERIFDNKCLENTVKHIGGEVVQLPPAEWTSLELCG